jgi:folate-dependent tRNA-U54 methylase TrmFO/GidA
MNVNFGLIPPLSARLRGRAKKEMLARRALADMAAWRRDLDVGAADAARVFETIALL